MKKNMGSIDRIIRVLFGVVVAVLYFTGQINGTLALVLGMVAAILLLTSLINFCPIYSVLGIHSNKKTA
jgi:hypothetical protein